MTWVCKVIMRGMQSATGHKPEHSYSAHHNSSSLLVKTHGNVLNTWWLYPVSCACCDSYSPLTTGMLVLCDELYAASSTLRDWCCVLKLKEKKTSRAIFHSSGLMTKYFSNMFHFNDMMFWEIWSIWIYYIVSSSVRRQEGPNTALWLANQALLTQDYQLTPAIQNIIIHSKYSPVSDWS